MSSDKLKFNFKRADTGKRTSIQLSWYLVDAFSAACPGVQIREFLERVVPTGYKETFQHAVEKRMLSIVASSLNYKSRKLLSRKMVINDVSHLYFRQMEAMLGSFLYISSEDGDEAKKQLERRLRACLEELDDTPLELDYHYKVVSCVQEEFLDVLMQVARTVRSEAKSDVG